jgi:hypothetical protein
MRADLADEQRTPVAPAKPGGGGGKCERRWFLYLAGGQPMGMAWRRSSVPGKRDRGGGSPAPTEEMEEARADGEGGDSGGVEVVVTVSGLEVVTRLISNLAVFPVPFPFLFRSFTVLPYL